MCMPKQRNMQLPRGAALANPAGCKHTPSLLSFFKSKGGRASFVPDPPGRLRMASTLPLIQKRNVWMARASSLCIRAFSAFM